MKSQRRHRLEAYPKVLCLVLMRWIGDERVVASHNVHMTRHLKIDEQTYTLCSMIVQRGTARSGHYWAICRHKVNQEDTWWVYNDAAELRAATDSDIDAPSDGTGAAHSYIVFYMLDTPERPPVAVGMANILARPSVKAKPSRPLAQSGVPASKENRTSDDPAENGCESSPVAIGMAPLLARAGVKAKPSRPLEDSGMPVSKDNRTSDDHADNGCESCHRRDDQWADMFDCLLYTSQSPRD